MSNKLNTELLTINIRYSLCDIDANNSNGEKWNKGYCVAVKNELGKSFPGADVSVKLCNGYTDDGNSDTEFDYDGDEDFDADEMGESIREAERTAFDKHC